MDYIQLDDYVGLALLSICFLAAFIAIAFVARPIKEGNGGSTHE